MNRRDFIKTASAVTAGVSATPSKVLFGAASGTPAKKNRLPTVYGAFVYPPSEILKKEGYYSWPGSSFDAEGRQKLYMKRIREIEGKLGMRIQIDNKPLDTPSDVSAFIDKVKREVPDGLLLIPFKKGHWEHILRIIDGVNLPTVIFATQGILLAPHIRDVKHKTGIYMINSLENLDAVEQGLKMISAGRRMMDSLIINITGEETREDRVRFIGTTVRTIPHQRFYKAFKQMKATAEVKALANDYVKNAVKIVEPAESDIVESAKTYFVFKKLIQEEGADAVMMNCLPGLRKPHQHVPPCMGYMNLRDEGIPMGCESDLDATLTMMLQQYLFDRPGFQHNPSVDTEKNLYFCAHCTAPTRMNGPGGPRERFILRNHAEAGWGVVPRVLMKADQEVTIAKYLSSKNGEKSQLLLYSGNIVGCPPNPPAGGCRTNVVTTISELDDVAQLKGHHLCMIYGNFVKELKTFSQLFDIEVVV